MRADGCWCGDTGLCTACVADPIPRTLTPEPVREPYKATGLGLGLTELAYLAEKAGQAEPETIRLDALAGPTETMEAAGFTNRGSLAYAMKERGFPQPVKTLRGIRLWDLDAVKNWTMQTTRNRTEP